jgi:hypothetical protein
VARAITLKPLKRLNSMGNANHRAKAAVLMRSGCQGCVGCRLLIGVFVGLWSGFKLEISYFERL